MRNIEEELAGKVLRKGVLLDEEGDEGAGCGRAVDDIAGATGDL